MERQCQICSRLFEQPRGPKKLVCSRECANRKRRKLAPRNCEVCGLVYPPVNSRQRACTPACSLAIQDQWRADHPDQVRLLKRRWAATHPESGAAYKAKNYERVRAWSKKSEIKNREKIRAYHKELNRKKGIAYRACKELGII